MGRRSLRMSLRSLRMGRRSLRMSLRNLSECAPRLRERAGGVVRAITSDSRRSACKVSGPLQTAESYLSTSKAPRTVPGEGV